MYLGNDDSAANLSKDQIVQLLIPRTTLPDLTSFKPDHMINKMPCTLHASYYVMKSNNNIKLLTPEEIEDFESPTLNANVHEERKINNNTIIMCVVSFRENEVAIVYGKIPIALSRQQLREHFEKEVSAKKGESDKKNGEGRNIGKGGESDNWSVIGTYGIM